jgi:hypothetical protein
VCDIANDFDWLGLTHPLPQVVLTVSRFVS